MAEKTLGKTHQDCCSVSPYFPKRDSPQKIFLNFPQSQFGIFQKIRHKCFDTSQQIVFVTHHVLVIEVNMSCVVGFGEGVDSEKKGGGLQKLVDRNMVLAGRGCFQLFVNLGGGNFI